MSSRFCLLALVAGLHLAAPATASGARPEGPLLVLVTLDTTRADRLGAWGGSASTPHLDALALEGVRFSRTDSSSPLTLPSHATLLTGLEPPRHGVRSNGPWALDPTIPTLASHLRRQGWDTAAVVSSRVLARARGLARDFRHYDDDVGDGVGGIPERRAAETTDRALEVLESLGKPAFLWVHYYDPHFPYRPPPSFRRTESGDAYDAELAYLDLHLGRLLDALPRSAIVVAVGDHGEALGEGGELRHGLLPWAGIRRVPLLLKGPGLPKGQVVQQRVRTVDVTPTLLQLTGTPETLGTLDGRSVLPLLRTEPGARAKAPPADLESPLSYWESFYPAEAFGASPLRALSDDTHLFVVGGYSSLHPVDGSAPESRALAAEPAVLQSWMGRMGALLEAWQEDIENLPTATSNLDPKARDELEALGYLSGNPHRSYDLDPRDSIGELVALQDLAGDVAARLSQGEACKNPTGVDLESELRRVARQLTSPPPLLTLLLARCRLAAREPEEALRLTEKAEQTPEVLVLRAQAHRNLEEIAASRRDLLEALRLDPAFDPAALPLVQSLRSSGDALRAAQVGQDAIEAGACSARLHFEVGMALVEGKREDPEDLRSALDHFSRSARLNPTEISPLLNAGELALRLDQPDLAVDYFRRASRLAPRSVTVWRSLAVALERIGKTSEARAASSRARALAADG